MRSHRHPFALVHVLWLGAGAVLAIGAWVLLAEGGTAYYMTPLRVRGYEPHHAALKPSGTVAHALGLAGLAMGTVPLVYAVRKKWSRLARAGSMATWLQVHIFCGIVGPVLVTFHTAFKFNGIVSVAYWSMVLVMVSGFAGRYWYVRIPKTIRGVELTRIEIESRAALLLQEVADAGVSTELLHRLAERHATRAGSMRRLRRALANEGIEAGLADSVVRTLAERSVLLGRLVYLERTKRLFAGWHLFHQPLVWIMFAIATVHVGVVLYMGYTIY